MTIEEELHSYLIADPGLAALIGDRLYPAGGQQAETLPYITYFTVSRESVHHAGGASDLYGPRVQFDCCGATRLQAVETERALRRALDGQRFGRIQGAFARNAIDLYDDAPELYRRSVDFHIWHSETEIET